MSPSWSDQPLSRWERRGLVFLLFAIVAFGILTEVRTVFLDRRMGDLEVFLWTAWAVRDGQDIYAITDHNGWHYLYPPLFAILLTPLADVPPNGPPNAWALPFPVTVAAWYLLSLAFLAIGVHVLANAIEQTSTVLTPPRRWGRRWWTLRIVPILVCLAPIGHTLARGQVNLLLLALLCAVAAALVRDRRGQAGGWLAGAICLKVIPAFLVLCPLWRRDYRALLACAAWLVVGLALVPMLVFGPTRTVAYYEEWNNAVIQPGLANGKDQSRAKEVIEMTATHSQSFVAVIHNFCYPDWNTRPPEASPKVRLAHWIIGAALTGLTLLAVGWRRTGGINALLFFGSLILLMMLLSPVCHTHYFCLLVPMIMGLLACGWERPEAPVISGGLLGLLVAFAVANFLIVIPGLELVRDLGLATGLALGIWGLAIRQLWQRRHTVEANAILPNQERRLAG
jgi:hypothetical protein